MISAAEPMALPRASARTEHARRAAASWARLLLIVFTPIWASALVLDFRVTLTIITFGAFLVTIAGLRQPAVGLYGLGILCTLDGMSTPLLLQGGLWRWNTFNYWLLAVIVLYLPLLFRHRSGPFRALVALLTLLGVGLLWSADKPNGIQHIFAAFSTFGLVVYFRRGQRFPDAWYWLAVVCGVTAACASLLFILGRSRLPELNENIWSHVPLMGLLAAALAFAAVRLTRRQQLWLALLSSANLATIFLSGSRGNLAMALCAVLAIAILTRSLSQNLLVLLATVLLAVGIIVQFPELGARTLGRLQIMTNEHETARRRTGGRFELAMGGWYIFKAHPIRGAGTGGFPKAYAALGRRPGLADFMIGKQMAAHAGWVKVFSENGVPGTLLMIAFVISFTVAGWRRRRWRVRVLGLMVTATMAIGFLTTEFQSKSLWFLGAGAMVLVTPDLHRRRRRRPRHGVVRVANPAPVVVVSR